MIRTLIPSWHSEERAPSRRRFLGGAAGAVGGALGVGLLFPMQDGPTMTP